MNLHEYQAKKLLSHKKLPIPDFGVASSLEEVEEILEQLPLEEAVVKIQVHAGGRGKAGGVKMGKSPQEIKKIAKDLLKMKIVNKQTGPKGVIAHKILLTRPVDIKKEYYLSFLIDRDKGAPVLIASKEGGMEIEEIAEKTPEKILSLTLPPSGKFRSYQLLTFQKFMGFEKELIEQSTFILNKLAEAFLELEATLLEINPLVVDETEKLWILDTKLTVDSDALFRHPELAACYDPTQLSKQEATASEFDLAYIAMEGNIGCMVNGAGLAMATMDIIQHYGGSPANFLDVGGGASKEKVAAGFRIILSDPKVKAVLINIFGGIMNCETLAQGIVEAAKELQITLPLIVRMEGTNVEKGKEILAKSKLSLITAKDLEDAAKKAVEAIQ